MAEAKAAAAAHGTALLICFGGNGRSGGFSPMVASKAARTRFIKELVALMEKHGVDSQGRYCRSAAPASHVSRLLNGDEERVSAE